MNQNPKILAVEQRLKAALEGSQERVDALNDLAWELWTTDRPRAAALASQGIALAEEIGYERGKAFAKLNNGILVWQEDVEASLPFLMDALDWFEKNHEKAGEGNSLAFLGIVYWGFGDFERGFEYALKSLKLYQEIGNQESEAWSHNTLGGFYYDLKNYDSSLSYFQQACDIFRKNDNRLGEARSLNGIGNANLNMGRCKRALVYQKKSLAILQEIGHRFSESRTLNDIGLCYQRFGELDEAASYHLKSLEIRRDLKYTVGQTTTLMDLGDLYSKQKVFNTALQHYQEGLKLSVQIKAKPKVARAHRALAEVYEQLQDFRNALQHWKAFHEVEEEIFHEDTDKKIKNLRAAYQLEASKKEAEIYRLRNVELKEKNDQLEESISKLNATQAQLIQSGKMVALGNLVAGIAHEINTPIGVIKSGNDVLERSIQRLMKMIEEGEPPAAIQEHLQKSLGVLRQTAATSHSASTRIVKLVHSLKNFARLDEAAFQKIDIHEGLDSTLTLLSYDMPQSLQVEKLYNILPPIYVYPAELNQVFMNLLMNAIQATPKDGKIIIRTNASNGQAVIDIIDSGKGIPQEKLGQLFEPGFSYDKQRVKMRTGLYTSYNIIQKHRGEIQVDSDMGEGTTFTITIPVNLNELIGNSATS